jgi:proton-translocating NADH-quinone oxidoreductase chain N
MLPELYLFFVSLMLLSYGVLYSTSKEFNYPILMLNISNFTIFSFIISLLLFISSPQVSISIFNNQLTIDFFSNFMKILILFSSLFCVIISLNYLKYNKVNSFEFFILIILATIGMLCLVSSNDFLVFYLFIELMSLCFYILAAYKRNSEFSGEAGLKYFILGAFSSGLLLFGISMIYGFTGLTNFEELSKLLTGIHLLVDTVSYNGILLGIFFVSVALLFKLAAAPFHMWSPDVYEGAPTPVTAFFSIVPKIAIFGLLLKLFLYTFYDFIDFWQPMFLYCSVLSMIIGSIGALYQSKLKRLMAYSGIANVGYMLAGFAAGTVESVFGLIFYLIVYVIMVVAFFTFLLGTQTKKNLKTNAQLSDLNNLGVTNPALAFAITMVLFSMIGLPPFIGFFGKFYLFLAMIQSEFYIVAIIGVLSSVVAAFYYIRIIKVMFFANSTSYNLYKITNKFNAYILSFSLFFLSFTFIYPHPLLSCIHKISLDLCL